MKNEELIIKYINILNRLKIDNILDNDINKSIDNTINKVNSIMAENKIKVAILGEFSSGKSTFINALLRKNILSYADEPTTAINTYITYGNKDKITIKYSNGSKKIIGINEINKFTKEGKAQSNIDRVNIEYNNIYLKKGITIIDTPGANIDNERHNIQRKRAIDECSVGIFLVSVKSLTSRSFIEFLKNNKDDLGKFIFVVSKCDILEEEGLDIDTNRNNDKLGDVLIYVKNSIKKYGGLENPVVYPISAYNFLNNISCSVLDVEKTFKDLENHIENIYNDHKDMLILLEILKILKKICSNIRNILNDKNKLCEYEIKKVNGEIESFELFVYNNYIEFIKNLDNKLYQEKENISAIITQRKKIKFNNAIFNIERISSIRRFKKSINGIIEGSINEFLNNSIYEVRNNLNKIGPDEFKKIEEDFKLYFSNLQKTYKTLGIERILKLKSIFKNVLLSIISYFISSILLKSWFKIADISKGGIYWEILPLIISIIMFIIYFKLDKTKIQYHIPYTFKKEKLSVSNKGISKDMSSEISEEYGLGAGAVIGALAGGPIGAIIGAGVGTILGKIFLSGRLEELKRECINVLKEEMDNTEIRLNIYIEDSIKIKRDLLIAEYKNYVGENMGLYKELLDGIYNYNNSRFISLSKSKNLLNNYLNSFEKINEEIDLIIENIKN